MKKMMTWRVVDIVVAAVLGVACGLLFWGMEFNWLRLVHGGAGHNTRFRGYRNGYLVDRWCLGCTGDPQAGCRDFRRSGGGLCVGHSG